MPLTLAKAVNQCMTTYYASMITNDIKLIQPSCGPGEQVEIKFNIYNKNNTITAGFIHYTIMVDDEEYAPQVDDLCSSINCPINMGKNEVALKFNMPSYLKPIHLYVELMDYGGRTFSCFRIRTPQSFWSWLVNLVSPSPVEPVQNVRKMLRGTIDYTESEYNITFTNQTVTFGPTAGMRPRSSASPSPSNILPQPIFLTKNTTI